MNAVNLSVKSQNHKDLWRRQFTLHHGRAIYRELQVFKPNCRVQPDGFHHFGRGRKMVATVNYFLSIHLLEGQQNSLAASETARVSVR